MSDLLLAEYGIRQLHARFADAVWRKDEADFGACWALDATWKIAGLQFDTRAVIVESFARLLAACAKVTILGSPPLFEIDVAAGTAVGRVQCTELAKMGDGSSAMTLGIYSDAYVRDGDRWLFQRRHFTLHYRGPIDLSADLVDAPSYGAFPGMPGPDEQTVTRRAPVL
ncbi:MAG: nuclear transport factor 2 family protein [Sphingobium sp.]